MDIQSEYQGKGYGTEAIQWALNWAFQMAGLHRVNVACFEYNPGAARLYEKLGFVLEGRKRQALWFHGRWWDLIELGVLEGEWMRRGLL